MSDRLYAFTPPAPCCARMTPTRTRHWRSLMGRLGDRLREALDAARQLLQRREPIPEIDAATLRDLGLSHAPASRTPREPVADPWR